MLTKEQIIADISVRFSKTLFATKNFLSQKVNDEDFDCIVMSEILESITNLDEFFQHASKLLSSEGTLVIVAPITLADFSSYDESGQRSDYSLNKICTTLSQSFFLSNINFDNDLAIITAINRASISSEKTKSPFLSKQALSSTIAEIEQNARIILAAKNASEHAERQQVKLRKKIISLEKKYTREKRKNAKLNNELKRFRLNPIIRTARFTKRSIKNPRTILAKLKSSQ